MFKNDVLKLRTYIFNLHCQFFLTLSVKKLCTKNRPQFLRSSVINSSLLKTQIRALSTASSEIFLRLDSRGLRLLLAHQLSHMKLHMSLVHLPKHFLKLNQKGSFTNRLEQFTLQNVIQHMFISQGQNEKVQDGRRLNA